MKTIGLLGGMSWESSLEYYRLINQLVRDRRGGNHSAECILLSVDFDPVEQLQHAGEWAQIARRMAGAAERLERAGAELLLLCTNTVHKVAGQIEMAVSIPFLHIADATARAIRGQAVSTVGLLGTTFTMEQDFISARFESSGIRCIVPDADDREYVHQAIYRELCAGVVLDSTRERFLQIIRRLTNRGAGGVVLGCTEIPLLVSQEHLDMPVFDTMALHARAAVDYALE